MGADRIYDHCNRVIERERLSPHRLITASNVRLICTTDDPVDDLADTVGAGDTFTATMLGIFFVPVFFVVVLKVAGGRKMRAAVKAGTRILSSQISNIQSHTGRTAWLPGYAGAN